MNRFLKKALVLMIPVFMVSCDEFYTEDGQSLPYFMKFYGDYYDDNLSDIKVTNNGEIFLAGHKTLTNGNEDAWLIKTQESGMVDWKISYQGSNDIRCYGLHIDQEVNVAGYELYEGSTTQKGFICQYNFTGSQLDSLSFDIGADEVKDIKFLTNNAELRFMVHAALNGDDWIYIYELSPTNEITLVTDIELFNTISGNLYFYEQDNGDLYLSGSIEEPDNANLSDIMLTRIVGENVAWSYTYGEKGIIEKSSGIVRLNDALYISATKMSDASGDDASVYLIKTDVLGFNPEEVNINISGVNESFNMIQNGDQEFVIVGDKQVDANNTKIFMIRTSLDGNVKLESLYGNEGVSHGKYVVKLTGAQNGFVIGGNLSINGDDISDVIVIKADEQGNWIY